MKHYKYIFLALLCIAQASILCGQQLKAVQRIEGIPAHTEYRAITHDNAGNIYVATSADVFMIPSSSNKAQPMSAGKHITDIDWSDEAGLIMLVDDGSVRFTTSGKVLTLDQKVTATCMDVTKSTIWVGTTNGVYSLSIPQEKILKHYTTDNGVLKSNKINFIHTDPYNIRWIGTDLGVVRVTGKKWKLYEEEQPITAITSTTEGAWMAAKQNMWLVDSYNRWYPIDAWKDLVQGGVRALSSDGQGLIYIASDILVKYDPYQEKIISMNRDVASEPMMLLAQGPGKNVWIAGDLGMAKIIEDTTVIIKPAEVSDELAATVEVKSTPVCTGMLTGNVSVKGSGGQPPYTYKWNYQGSTQRELSGLPPGLYQVTLTDASGKTTLASGIVSSSPEISATVLSEANASDKLAADGKAVAIVKGGAEPFQVLWGNGETALNATTLTEGSHTVRIIDANGCIANGTVTISAEKVLKSLDISTLKLGETIRVDKLYFAADSSTIQPISFAVLEEIYEFLKNNDKVIIEIGGHTNSLPTDEYCDRLSTTRAKNIATYLYGRGIPEAQISYKGYGKRQPVASNLTVDGRRKNQRVEIKIVSL
ncbi:MAG TPA: OmpA family protein [Saprospiraceae bacterium]|nr:OmpA family protein [Saprospiraceae bacterium]